MTRTSRKLAEGAHGKWGDFVPRAPSVRNMIKKCRRKLVYEIAKLEERLSEIPEGEGKDNLALDLASAQARSDNFEDLVAHVPPGMRLVVDYHAPVGQEQSCAVRHEWSSKGLRNALRYAAENFPHELKKLNMCDHGIRQMSYGLRPANSEGHLYNIQAHHIRALSGAGAEARKKGCDPLLPQNRRKNYLINHLGNIEWVAGELHDRITLLHNVQLPNEKTLRMPQHILAYAPVRRPGHSGFVCLPQPDILPGGLSLLPSTPAQDVARTVSGAGLAIKEVQRMKAHPALWGLSRAFRAAANDPEVNTARVPLGDPVLAPGAFREAFTAAVNGVPSLRAQLDSRVRPVLGDVATEIERVFNRTAEPYAAGGDDKPYHRLRKHLNCGAMKDLRRLVRLLPLEEAARVEDVFDTIEKKIPDMEERRRRATVAP
jgi:hypothetical protein